MGFACLVSFAASAVLRFGGTSVQEDKPKAPDASARKQALTEIRDLFKDEYAKRDPESRRALAAKLLNHADKSQGDAISAFVLLDEARSLSAESGDVPLAFSAIDKMAEIFDLAKSAGVDAPRQMKMDALAKAQRVARAPDDARSVAKGYLAVGRQASSEGDFKTAQDAVRKASSLARKLRDRVLSAQATEFSKVIPELKREFTTASDVDLSKAIDIGETKTNLTIGRYLAFVKGDWEKGLEYLQWSGKGPLADVAKKELAGPEDPSGQFAVAEAWWALSEKERSPLHRKRYLTRARIWYEKSDKGAEGILKLKIEKRLDSLVTLAPGEVNLLRLIRPKEDAVTGEWAFKGRTLVTPNGPRMLLEIAYQPPAEYDIELLLTPVEGAGTLIIGLVAENRQFNAILNGTGGATNGLELLDGKPCDRNETTKQGGALTPQKTSTIRVSVRKSGVRMVVDGTVITDWKGKYSRLGVNPSFKVSNPRALSVACWESVHHIRKMILRPVSGQGKNLR